jgi:hypothetical protein
MTQAIHNPNSASIRQLTPTEQDVLGSVVTLLSEMEDLLIDLTTNQLTETQLSSRIRVLAARSLLSDLTELRPAISRLANSAPVLIGKIDEDYGADVLR